MIYPLDSVIQPLNNWGQMFTLFSGRHIGGLRRSLGSIILHETFRPVTRLWDPAHTLNLQKMSSLFISYNRRIMTRAYNDSVSNTINWSLRTPLAGIDKLQDIQERQMILMIHLTFHHKLTENKVKFIKCVTSFCTATYQSIGSRANTFVNFIS